MFVFFLRSLVFTAFIFIASISNRSNIRAQIRTTNIAPIYEDEAFQSKVQHNLQDSITLIKEAFEESQLLAIGEPNHIKSTTPRLIAQFLSDLKKINDKSLKYIFVERSQELKKFFEALSMDSSLFLTFN